MTKVALIGCGGWGKNLARNLHELGALHSIVDPSAAAQELAKAMGVAWSATPDAVMADKTIAAVAIATPAATHAEVAMAALHAGKDVFVEKPIALSMDDGKKMQDLAAQLGRILMVGHLLQYHPVFQKLREMVRSGSLGKIRHIASSRLNLGMLRSEENVMWSFAPHDISMVLALAGQPPSNVSAVGTTILQEGIPDITTLHLEFPGGLKADITSSWLSPQKEQKIVVIGDEGMAVFSDTRPWAEKLQLFRNKVAWANHKPKAVAGEATFVDVPQGEPLKLELQHFIACIESRAQPRTGADEALPVLAVLRAGQASLDLNGQKARPSTMPAAADWAARNVFVHKTAIVDAGVEIGAGSKIWHFSHILGKSRLGANCVVSQNVMIGPEVTVGNGCKIQNNVSLYKGVTLEDDVFCGPSMVFTNVLTPRAHVERKAEFAPTRIGKGATLGANCTIVCGHDVGAYAMVGAGAVVTKTVPAHALVVGNPARQIGWVSKAGERLGPDMKCPRTGEQYDFPALMTHLES